MKKVSVVTVNYNTEEETHALLASLQKSHVSDFSLSIIVVDNGSKDIFSLSEKEKAQNISLIRSETNTGFTGGYNIGIREALRQQSEFILLLNSDTLVDPFLIQVLQQTLEQNEKIGIVSPKIYFAKGHEFHKDRYKENELGKVFWFAGGNMDWDHVQSKHRGVDEVDHGQYDTSEKIGFATGCCMMVRREVFEKVGLFDERYFLYYEDADFSQRVEKAGYELWYQPKAEMWHINASSTGGAGNGNTTQDYFITRNQMLFGMKYAPPRSKLALIRQSVRLLWKGRLHQQMAIRDYYFGRFGEGTSFK